MAPKRKRAEEYSDNPHTVKERKRREKLSEEDAEIERARNNLNRQLTYHRGKLKDRPEYQAAPPEEQKRLLAEIENEIIQKKLDDGEHWVHVAKKYGKPTPPLASLFRQVEEAFKDEEFEDEIEEEQYVRDDDRENHGEIADTNFDPEEAAQLVAKNAQRVLALNNWKRTQLFWTGRMRSVARKVRAIKKKPEEELVVLLAPAKFQQFVMEISGLLSWSVITRAWGKFVNQYITTNPRDAYKQDRILSMIEVPKYRPLFVRIAQEVGEYFGIRKSNRIGVSSGGMYLPPPHYFFTESELAAWRTMMAASCKVDDYELLGSSELWPSGYKEVEYGWEWETIDQLEAAAVIRLVLDTGNAIPAMADLVSLHPGSMIA